MAMCLFKKKRSPIRELRESIKNETVDYSALFSNIGHREDVEMLYKELCSASHPDRFVGNVKKQAIAQDTFKEIQTNRDNYSALIKIKSKILKLNQL